MGCQNGKSQNYDEKRKIKELISMLRCVQKQIDITTEYFSLINPIIYHYQSVPVHDRFDLIWNEVQSLENSSQQTLHSWSEENKQINEYFDMMKELQIKLQELLQYVEQTLQDSQNTLSPYQKAILKKQKSLYAFAFETIIPQGAQIFNFEEKQKQSIEEVIRNMCLSEIIC